MYPPALLVTVIAFETVGLDARYHACNICRYSGAHRAPTNAQSRSSSWGRTGYMNGAIGLSHQPYFFLLTYTYGGGMVIYNFNPPTDKLIKRNVITDFSQTPTI